MSRCAGRSGGKSAKKWRKKFQKSQTHIFGAPGALDSIPCQSTYTYLLHKKNPEQNDFFFMSHNSAETPKEGRFPKS